MEVEVKEKNELIAITFSHSVAMEDPYFMYVVRMSNGKHPKYCYKVFSGVDNKTANSRAFIDDIASYGDKLSDISDSLKFVMRNIKQREDEEKSKLEDEEYFWWKAEEESYGTDKSYEFASSKL